MKINSKVDTRLMDRFQRFSKGIKGNCHRNNNRRNIGTDTDVKYKKRTLI